MSFLDNLENNLKALESREEKDPEKVRQDLERREAERRSALESAPVAERLKNSEFTEKFLVACRTVGHRQRTMVRITWLDRMLRLEAKEKRLDLKPTAEGVAAIYFRDGVEERRELLTLAEDPEKVATQWLETS